MGKLTTYPNWDDLPSTLPKTNIAPENGWLEYYFPIGMAHFQVQKVSFREGTFGAIFAAQQYQLPEPPTTMNSLHSREHHRHKKWKAGKVNMLVLS